MCGQRGDGQGWVWDLEMWVRVWVWAMEGWIARVWAENKVQVRSVVGGSRGWGERRTRHVPRILVQSLVRSIVRENCILFSGPRLAEAGFNMVPLCHHDRVVKDQMS